MGDDVLSDTSIDGIMISDELPIPESLSGLRVEHVIHGHHAHQAQNCKDDVAGVHLVLQLVGTHAYSLDPVQCLKKGLLLSLQPIDLAVQVLLIVVVGQVVQVDQLQASHDIDVGSESILYLVDDAEAVGACLVCQFVHGLDGRVGLLGHHWLVVRPVMTAFHVHAVAVMRP